VAVPKLTPASWWAEPAVQGDREAFRRVLEDRDAVRQTIERAKQTTVDTMAHWRETC
jgi:hypothetical protein